MRLADDNPHAWPSCQRQTGRLSALVDTDDLKAEVVQLTDNAGANSAKPATIT